MVLLPYITQWTLTDLCVIFAQLRLEKALRKQKVRRLPAALDARQLHGTQLGLPSAQYAYVAVLTAQVEEVLLF